MPNLYQFVDWVTMESLRILINKSQVGQFMNTDYNKEFKREFAVGETVRVKLPQRFLVRDGLGYTPQPIDRKYTTVKCDQIFGIDFEWDSVEAALKQERGEEAIRREYIEPAMSQLATELDSRCALFAYQNCPNITGVLGTAIASLQTFRTARTILNEQSCPPGNRGMIITPSTEETAVGLGQAVFNPSSEISRQYRDGSIGKYGGFDWYEANNLYQHTAGTWAGAVTVNGAGQSGSTLTITATAGDTFLVGDVFSLNLVSATNPANRRTTGRTKTFTITQQLTAAGGGVDVINFYPPIYGPGSQYQNVTALPADTAALTLFPGTAGPNGLVGFQNLALTKDAFALVGVKLETPKAVELASTMRDPATGISISFVRQFDGRTRTMINRFDVLCGFGVLYGENAAVRVLGGTT